MKSWSSFRESEETIQKLKLGWVHKTNEKVIKHKENIKSLDEEQTNKDSDSYLFKLPLGIVVSFVQLCLNFYVLISNYQLIRHK